MAKRTPDLETAEQEDEAEIQKLMAELNISRDAAALLLTIERGYGLVDDRISLTGDQSLDEYLAELEQSSEHRFLSPAPTGRSTS